LKKVLLFSAGQIIIEKNKSSHDERKGRERVNENGGGTTTESEEQNKENDWNETAFLLCCLELDC
jgi:hypothetical protein